ncbi:hypothetical protein LTR09_008588 [Extremus antarcticus]|uniref:Major facilitator superfamily (MFS) profile domain-containing protein n=1 Tax=Extremus antarcticus TaxID=702011 RepID=A0AAJ0DHW8_9PEZI|nr:hypothetical protein LTR09_008588 [Extremus antarcticus]
MSRSSTSDEVEKEIGFDKQTSQNFNTEEHEDLAEAEQPAFVVHDDIEKSGGPADYDGASLANVQSEKPSVNNIKSVPNGGGIAWLQVLCSFFVFFNTWGIINAFGIYQEYYTKGILTSSSPSDISWIGSLEAFLLMIVGSIAGPIYDMGYVHELLGVGSVLIVLGQMMLSLCSNYWQVILAQGVSIGIGTGCIFVSGVAILSTYFSTKLATATGIAASGSSIGGMLYPIIFYKLQPTIGFAWATRVLAFVALFTLGISNLALRVRVIPSSRRKFLDLPAWKELPFLFFNLGSFFTFIGLYAPFFYIQSYVLDAGLMEPDLAFYLLAILNGASTFGRLIPNYIADRVGPFNVLTPCALMCAILQYCLISAHSSASVIVIIAFYGFFSGTLVSLPATCYVHLAGPTRRGLIGTWMGMGFAFVSLGILCGTPITGAILGVSSFKYVWVFGATFELVGSVFFVLSRLAQAKWRIWVKV